MSWRDPQWLQRGLDAMQATFDVDSTTKQQMIDFLLAEGFWDTNKLTPAAARTKFNACMNPMKPDFFKLSELWVLMKRFRRYELWLAMGEDMGFECPQQIPLTTRRADLERQLLELRQQSQAQLEALENALTRLDDVAGAAHSSGTVRIHPVMREAGPRFDVPDEDVGHGEGGF